MPTFNKKNLTKEEKRQYKETINNLSYLVNNFNNLEEKYLKDKIKGLSIIEIHLLDTIYKNPMKTTTEIAGIQNITVGAMMTCLKKLYNLGYVERIEDDKDKRIVHLQTTELVKPIMKIHEELHTVFVDSLIDDNNLDDVYNLSIKLVENLNKLKNK